MQFGNKPLSPERHSPFRCILLNVANNRWATETYVLFASRETCPPRNGFAALLELDSRVVYQTAHDWRRIDLLTPLAEVPVVQKNDRSTCLVDLFCLPWLVLDISWYCRPPGSVKLPELDRSAVWQPEDVGFAGDGGTA